MHLATDWEPYADHMMDVLSATEALENVAGDRQFSPRPSLGLKPSLNAEAIAWVTVCGTYCSANAKFLLAKLPSNKSALYLKLFLIKAPHIGANEMPHPALNKCLDERIEVLIASRGALSWSCHLPSALGDAVPPSSDRHSRECSLSQIRSRPRPP